MDRQIDRQKKYELYNPIMRTDSEKEFQNNQEQRYSVVEKIFYRTRTIEKGQRYRLTEMRQADKQTELQIDTVADRQIYRHVHFDITRTKAEK